VANLAGTEVDLWSPTILYGHGHSNKDTTRGYVTNS